LPSGPPRRSRPSGGRSRSTARPCPAPGPATPPPGTFRRPTKPAPPSCRPSTDDDGHTNQITAFQPLLDQLGDLRDTVITADALQVDATTSPQLAERGADWILTVKAN
jgi:hypothetical protein